MVYRKIDPPVRDSETGCLLWQGKLQPNGYPHRAHRVAYVKAFGPIPEGMVIDHVWEKGCRHKHCVEPSHLEAVTQKANVQRYLVSKGMGNSCSKGHKFTPENTLIKKTGRACKTCQRRYWREYQNRASSRT